MKDTHRKRQLAGALLILSMVIAGVVPAAYAELQRVGPNNPALSVGNFPAWYQDNTGLTLEFCDPKSDAELDGGWCLLARDIPASPGVDPVPGVLSVPEVFPTNFFDEHFWYAADADALDGSPNSPLIRALLVIAVEAAFIADVEPGGQVAFARIRVRLDDAPVSGTYTFIHPYGEEIIEGVAGERIFFTEDVGINCAQGHFDCALQSRLGPFLLPSDEPGGAELPAVTGPAPDNNLYIADPGRSGPVTGSPTGNNFFRIVGPPGSNLDGNGSNIIETSNFTLMGRVFRGALPGQVTVDRASYTRNSTEQKADVFATAFETAPGRLPTEPVPAPVLPQLSFFDAPCTPSALDNNLDPIPPFSAPVGATEIPMANVGNNFWGQVQLAAIPDSVCVKDNVTNTFYPKNVVDEITITQAFFDPAAQSLSAQARSSDSTVPPTLTLGGFGDLDNGEILVPSLSAAPATIRVLSTAGGVNEYQVTTSPLPPPPPVATASLTSNPASPQLTGTAVTLVASANGGTGIYEFEFQASVDNGATWFNARNYTSDPTWFWATGPGTFLFRANVRNAGTTTGVATSAPLPYTITTTPPVTGPDPATGATLAGDPVPASPPSAGTPVTFTASGEGGTGSYEFEFQASLDGVNFFVARGYSTDNTWIWATAPGTYHFRANVRSQGSTAAVTSNVLTYTITTASPAQATGAGLTGDPDPANPPAAGIPVTFTASGEGGTGSYEYEFQASLDGVNFFVARNYTTDPQWIWATAPGTYHFRANVRSQGSTVAVTSVVLTYVIN